MSENPLCTGVRTFYNNRNKDLKIKARLNDWDLTKHQVAIFNQLSEEIKKRYYGSGLNIPEKVEGKRIIDLGCGSGSFVFILSKLVGPQGYVVGVDLSDGLIETAKAEVDYHVKQWGYDKPNFEFRVGNLENLDELALQPGSFDIVVSNGAFCLVPDKEAAFRHAFSLLKEGGQFYLNDVYCEREAPEELRNNNTLWSMGTAGAMQWDKVAEMAVKVGFTTPYMTCAAPVDIVNEEYNVLLEYRRYSCTGWRFFKLPPGAQREASRVTYNGNIPAYPEVFPWDVDLSFKKGEGVNVDANLATILASSYLSDSFSFEKAHDSPMTNRNQNPFAHMDKLKAEGRLPDPIYKVE